MMSSLEEARSFFNQTLIIGQLKARIEVTRRRKNDRFTSDDLLFHINFASDGASRGKIVLMDILLSVNTICSALIERLREFYNTREKRLIFPAFETSNTTSLICIGVVDLHQDKQIVNKLMRKLMLYLTSDAEASLSDGLVFKCTLLSRAHTEASQVRTRLAKAKPYLRDKYPAPPSNLKNRLLGNQQSKILPNLPYVADNTRGSLFVIPNGYPQCPRAFTNACAIVAFSTALLYLRARQNGQQDSFSKRIRQLHHSRAKDQNVAGRYLRRKTLDIIDPLKISPVGPHSYDQLNELCAYYEVQAIIFSKILGGSPALVLPYKEMHIADTRFNLDPKKPILFFFESPNIQNPKIYHLDVIVKPDSYYRKNKVCFLCLKIFFERHTCHVRPSCRFCNRKKLFPGDYFSSIYQEQMCPRLIEKSDKKMEDRCVKCCQVFTNQSCFIAHKKRCLGLCQICGVKKKTRFHQCNWLPTCKKCHEVFENYPQQLNNHICKMQPAKFQTYFAPLIVLDIETYTSSNNELRDMLLVAYFEKFVYGNFWSIAFGHDGFEHEDLNIVNTSAFSFDYLPPEIPNKLHQGSTYRRAVESCKLHLPIESVSSNVDVILREFCEDEQNYLNNVRKNFNFVSKKYKQTPIFKFLCYILTKKFRNRTIIGNATTKVVIR